MRRCLSSVRSFVFMVVGRGWYVFQAKVNVSRSISCVLCGPLTRMQVNRVSGVIYKSFKLPGEAQAWLQGIADAIPPRGPLTQQSESQRRF